MWIIRDNIIPFLFTLLIMCVFFGAYYYITADISAYRPEHYLAHSEIKGRVESEKSVVVADVVTLDEYYKEPDFLDNALELKAEKFDTGLDEKLLIKWLDE